MSDRLRVNPKTAVEVILVANLARWLRERPDYPFSIPEIDDLIDPPPQWKKPRPTRALSARWRMGGDRCHCGAPVDVPHKAMCAPCAYGVNDDCGCST